MELCNDVLRELAEYVDLGDLEQLILVCRRFHDALSSLWPLFKAHAADNKVDRLCILWKYGFYPDPQGHRLACRLVQSNPLKAARCYLLYDDHALGNMIVDSLFVKEDTSELTGIVCTYNGNDGLDFKRFAQYLIDVALHYGATDSVLFNLLELSDLGRHFNKIDSHRTLIDLIRCDREDVAVQWMDTPNHSITCNQLNWLIPYCASLNMPNMVECMLRHTSPLATPPYMMEVVYNDCVAKCPALASVFEADFQRRWGPTSKRQRRKYRSLKHYLETPLTHRHGSLR